MSGKFEWAPTTVSVRSDRTWPLMFQALQEFCSVAQRKPVTSIPENLIYRNHEGVSIKLGRWMHTQNKLHRNNKLRQDRLVRFHQELINTGLFCWPMSRGTRNSFVNKQNQQNMNHNYINNMDGSLMNQQQLMNGHNLLSTDPSLLLNKNNLHPMSGEVSFGSSAQLSAQAQALHQARQQQIQAQSVELYRQQQQYIKMYNETNKNMLMSMNNDPNGMQQQQQQYNNLNVLSGVLNGHNGMINPLEDDDDSEGSQDV
eukprot:gene22511-28640_t